MQVLTGSFSSESEEKQMEKIPNCTFIHRASDFTILSKLPTGAIKKSRYTHAYIHLVFIQRKIIKKEKL